MTSFSCYLLCCVWLLNLVSNISSYNTAIDLNQYLQPDEVTVAQFQSGRYCARQCRKNEPPRKCYYRWIVGNYVTVGHACGDCPNNITDCYAPQCVTADGYEKGIQTVNRRFPGPSIEVCLGDEVIIDITNEMPAKSTAIHWHGVLQKGTPYMDGVPGVTQCSIPEGNTFRYDFWANNEGTHYWHSHDGLQKLDGIQGNFVTRIPKEDEPSGRLYDYDLPEHKIFVADWIHFVADDKFPGYRFHSLGQDAENFLLNGYGQTKLPESQGNRSSDYPLAVVNVSKNKRYRFRMVGALCTVCGVEFSIEGHNMTVIATDGNPVKPVTVNSVILYSGERYDVVVIANQPPKNYWIHMRGLSLCEENRIYGLGILKYKNAPAEEFNSEKAGYNGFTTNVGKVLNPENATCGEESNNVCVTDLQSTSRSNIGPFYYDYIIPLTFGFHYYEVQDLFRPNQYELYYVVPDGSLLLSLMNNISHTAPSSPLLSQYRESMKDQCPIGQNGLPTCPANRKKQGYCECTHVIKVPLRSVIYMVLSDATPTADLHHPFHLHGHTFNVMAMGQFKDGQTISDIYAAVKSRSLPLAKNPALKDAVAVPSNGYVVIRFYTDNPGFWFFHCHFMYHLATGMALVIQVGGPRDWPPVPAGFPRCGNYQPPAYYEDYGNGMNYPYY